MSAYLNGGPHPVPPTPRAEETWLVAPIWERIERKVDRLTTLVYVVIGMGPIVLLLYLVIPWITGLFGPAT